MTMTEQEKAEKIFARARDIIHEAEIEAELCHDTPQDVIQKLAFRIAKLEHADLDEYGKE